MVGPATGELTTVSTIDSIKAYYNVTEQAYVNFTKLFSTESDRYDRLRKLEIELILSDGTVYPEKGRIYAADRQIGQTTGALRLEALFPNTNYALRAGQFARVRVKFDLKRDTLLAPQRAVSEYQSKKQTKTPNRKRGMSKMRAAQISGPSGPFELVERPIPEPGPGWVRIKVQACGICHSDSLVKEGLWPGLQYPRVPGHEVVGIVDALGTGAEPWKVGQRVGVGWHGGHCGHCDACRRGEFFACQVALKVTGISFDGGYAEYMAP